uniref:Uncharacterized protein n=1 Tax=Chromera velia CCMP2878 TaxID=1169474 RepID=A0A0G4F2W4_9ALVE|eukprot:Cvel_2676.t1-p1 / transcript=Cvel_2676.t1 / gene=Cvel_2676 / organism=Chromera_velia_CCMP2878 / gene_product=hypothetical protein / transcript_product=hypothetical protein / location=Cvel_scaffold107:15959-16642(+) / protein_length=152 / sequence_SO=supercontig / SO=protein_coding / is_pseudo=false
MTVDVRQRRTVKYETGKVLKHAACSSLVVLGSLTAFLSFDFGLTTAACYTVAGVGAVAVTSVGLFTYYWRGVKNEVPGDALLGAIFQQLIEEGLLNLNIDDAYAPPRDGENAETSAVGCSPQADVLWDPSNSGRIVEVDTGDAEWTECDVAR